jgi:cell division ATPase FtsA
MELAGVGSSAYVSGIAALVEDEQELGAACIDLGGGSAGLSIFIKKHMIYADCVRIGGDHVTSDISMGLQVPQATAERIKTFYDGLASRILGQRVRLGRPLRVHGLPQAATGPAFASAVGMCLFAANPQDEWWDFDIPVDRYPARSLRRAVKWFRDNW